MMVNKTNVHGTLSNALKVDVGSTCSAGFGAAGFIVVIGFFTTVFPVEAEMFVVPQEMVVDFPAE